MHKFFYFLTIFNDTSVAPAWAMTADAEMQVIF
jgi:hypothetical protein